MLTVLCLRTGDRYAKTYVHALARAVERHLSQPHRFICMTDDPEGLDCRTIPVPLGLPRWWGKLYAFSADWTDRVLFMDLDTVVLGPLDGFAATTRPFACIRPFYRPGGIASGLMSIAPGTAPEVWRRFARDPGAAIAATAARADPPWNHGDQRWLELMGLRPAYWQDLLPGQLVSWKVHCRAGVPPGARVVAFHGRPDPHEVADPIIRAAWRGRAPP